MHSQVVKWFSIAALLAAVLSWKSAANYQLELKLVVCVAAAVVLTQAFQAKKYPWACRISCAGSDVQPPGTRLSARWRHRPFNCGSLHRSICVRVGHVEATSADVYAVNNG